jgi:hypothetical protein
MCPRNPQNPELELFLAVKEQTGDQRNFIQPLSRRVTLADIQFVVLEHRADLINSVFPTSLHSFSHGVPVFTAHCERSSISLPSSPTSPPSPHSGPQTGWLLLSYFKRACGFLPELCSHLLPGLTTPLPERPFHIALVLYS